MPPFFEPILGGALIGIGSLLAMLGSGKIPGISGIVGRILRPNPGDTVWRIVFLVALICGAGLALFFGLGWQGFSIPAARSLAVFATAGLLVGFGTRMGGGCTSGHGVCGMGSGARDAMVYTAVFMITAIITVFLWNMITGAAAA